MDDQRTDLQRLRLNAGEGLFISAYQMGEGIPVVFIHGSGPGASGPSNFYDNMRAFAQNGFRAITFDLLGYGDSSKPEDKKYDLDLQVSALKALFSGLQLNKAIVVGNSLGGAVAMRFTMDYPQLVEKLVLLAPGGLASKFRYIRMPGIRSMMWAQLGPGGPTLEKLKRVFRLQLFDPSLLPESVIKERLAVARTQPKQVYRTLKVNDLRARLGEIKCPTLVFWGTNDNFCPLETSLTLVESIPDCQMIVVSRCGHWVQVEHPETFNREAMAFIRR